MGYNAYNFFRLPESSVNRESNMTDIQDKGLIAYENGDFETAFAEWKILAEEDNAQACHNLAILYGTGKGVVENPKLAKHWCERAALLGDVSAQTHLGYLCAHDEEAEQAVHWWKKAADAGDADAQNQLGLAYFMGAGVKQDNEMAADWFEAAAIQDYPEAQFNFGVLYANARRFEHAKHWWTKAAALGDENAQNALKQLEEANI
ncbi:tetratricopeptide repeat protein [Wielerella bovis]|uniref:tetratricopeptide repeat protein n=1 Tax=Wielerella bovis TaxID=2917790 RepID=UPI0020193B43|nr:tetratricopeptide repeat protein [Wielerella bovis]ULJ63862.1 sel1 repeat family protein [Wielerella bovis]ULJ65971.1 sel1 repeat family protein [Wielerella bovis]